MDVVDSTELEDVSEVASVELDDDGELVVDELVVGESELELRTGFGLI